MYEFKIEPIANGLLLVWTAYKSNEILSGNREYFQEYDEVVRRIAEILKVKL